MKRKLAIAAPLILATAAVIWSGLCLPPVKWVLKYGPWPGCEPTGEIITVEGIEFVVIGPGIARIGSSWLADERRGDCTNGDLLGRVVGSRGPDWGETAVPSDEMPVHWVQFPEGFALARTEITDSQYERLHPEHRLDVFSKGDAYPVVDVIWEEARAYCAWLAKKSGRPVRLPSESEWECACRAGGSGEYCFGDDEAGLGEYAWYIGNWRNGAHRVGTKKPNAWGLYDLHGNVGEWCEDLWHDSYVVTGPVAQPDGKTMVEVLSRSPTDGTAWLYDGGSPVRVYRGGCWRNDPVRCRSSFRSRSVPGNRVNVLGFRPAMGD